MEEVSSREVWNNETEQHQTDPGSGSQLGDHGPDLLQDQLQATHLPPQSMSRGHNATSLHSSHNKHQMFHTIVQVN